MNNELYLSGNSKQRRIQKRQFKRNNPNVTLEHQGHINTGKGSFYVVLNH